jgi:hypothetical protein
VIAGVQMSLRYILHCSCLGLGLLFSLSTSAYPAGLQVKLVSITSPVQPGGTVTLVIATEPGAACTGHRQDHFFNERRLRPPIVGSDGRMQWSWQVLSGKHPGGVRAVHVTCTKNNQAASISTAFDVR